MYHELETYIYLIIPFTKYTPTSLPPKSCRGHILVMYTYGSRILNRDTINPTYKSLHHILYQYVIPNNIVSIIQYDKIQYMIRRRYIISCVIICFVTIHPPPFPPPLSPSSFLHFFSESTETLTFATGLLLFGPIASSRAAAEFLELRLQ